MYFHRKFVGASSMAKTRCARRKGIFWEQSDDSKTCVGFSRQGKCRGPRLVTFGKYSAKAHFHEGLHPSTAINTAIFAFVLVCETWIMDECNIHCYVLYSRAGEEFYILFSSLAF